MSAPWPVRIAILHNRYRLRGGEDVVVANESRLLRERGHDVASFSVDNRDVDEWGMREAFGTVWSRRSAEAVDRFIQEEQPDLVHVHNTFPLLSPSVYAPVKRRGLPLVQTLHNYRLICPAATCFRDGEVCLDCRDRSIPWPAVAHSCYRSDRAASATVAAMLAVHRLVGTWRNRVDAFIALSPSARDQFIQGGLPEDRLHVRPNFVPDLPFSRERSTAGSVLFLGRLAREKGVQVLVDAWRDDLPTLEVVGDGPLLEELERVAAPNVVLRGRFTPEEVDIALREARFLVVPSIWFEGCPMVVLEAFVRGLPVVASDIGSLRDFVVEGTSGRRFPAGDVAALNRLVRELCSDPAQLKRLSRGARAAYESMFSEDLGYDALMRVYGAARRRASTTDGRPYDSRPRPPVG